LWVSSIVCSHIFSTSIVIHFHYLFNLFHTFHFILTKKEMKKGGTRAISQNSKMSRKRNWVIINVYHKYVCSIRLGKRTLDVILKRSRYCSGEIELWWKQELLLLSDAEQTGTDRDGCGCNSLFLVRPKGALWPKACEVDKFLGPILMWVLSYWTVESSHSHRCKPAEP